VSAAAPASTGARVLVVEDDALLAGLVADGLQAEGHRVDVCGDGEQALDHLADLDYDAVVLDLNLPGLDGIEVCRLARQSGCTSRILMLTTRTDVADRVDGLDAGADDYLAKPFSLQELAARVRALLRRSVTAVADQVTVGTITLDLASHRAHVSGREVLLTNRSFALLAAFLAHPGEVLARTWLLDHVWDHAVDYRSNLVDVEVRRLRARLGVDAIETVRGLGYRLRSG